jgi:hypothetical protein
MRHAIPVLVILAGLTGCTSMEEFDARDEATCARKELQADGADFNACVAEQQMLRSNIMTRF